MMLSDSMQRLADIYSVLKMKNEKATLQIISEAKNPEVFLEVLETQKEMQGISPCFKTKIYETILQVRRTPALLRNYAYHLLFNGKAQELDKVQFLLYEADNLERFAFKN